MKERILLLAMLLVAGCGTPEDAASPKTSLGIHEDRERLQPDRIRQTEGPTATSRRGETKDTRSDYAKGVVTLKTGRKVKGYILLQCPGYLTVCFKINSSEEGSSELIPYEDVQSVTLEKPLSDLDPIWAYLRKEMTIVDGTGRH